MSRLYLDLTLIDAENHLHCKNGLDVFYFILSNFWLINDFQVQDDFYSFFRCKSFILSADAYSMERHFFLYSKSELLNLALRAVFS